MADPIHTTIIPRKEAKALGLVRYFTGTPCLRGHVSERITTDGQCRACAARRRNLPEIKAQRTTPEYKAKKSMWMKTYYLKNPEKMREKKKIYRQKNPEKCKAADKKKIARWRKLYPFYTSIRDAQNRGRTHCIPCTVTRAWARKRWTGFCEVTGLPFIQNGKKVIPFSISLDKINPELGYLQSNCRFVLMGYNMLKGVGTDDDALKIAKALVENASH